MDLKKLNSVYKREYAKVLLSEHDDMKALVKYQKDKIEEKIDDVEDLVMGIEDIHDDWDHAEEQINIALAEKAAEVGITDWMLRKKQYFQEFQIQDHFKDLSTCEVCWKGAYCEKHPFEKQQQRVQDQEKLYVHKRREWYAPPTAKVAGGPHRVAQNRF